MFVFTTSVGNNFFGLAFVLQHSLITDKTMEPEIKQAPPIGNIVNISISVRRLRDLGKRWGWIFIQLIPFLGFLYFMFLMSLPTKGLYDK